MDKIDLLNQVAAFHQTFNHPILEVPQIPSKERCKLRVALIVEELEELKAAIEKEDLVEIADAFCDIQYVLSGAILEFGLGDKFGALFNEVQRSNLSKACNSEEEAKKTVDYYQRERNTEAYYEEHNGKYLVYRKKDNKTLKSINYSSVDLKSILERK